MSEELRRYQGRKRIRGGRGRPFSVRRQVRGFLSTYYTRRVRACHRCVTRRRRTQTVQTSRGRSHRTQASRHPSLSKTHLHSLDFRASRAFLLLLSLDDVTVDWSQSGSTCLRQSHQHLRNQMSAKATVAQVARTSLYELKPLLQTFLSQLCRQALRCRIGQVLRGR